MNISGSEEMFYFVLIQVDTECLEGNRLSLIHF